MACWKIHHERVDVVPIQDGDFPASYVCFPGVFFRFRDVFWCQGSPAPSKSIKACKGTRGIRKSHLRPRWWRKSLWGPGALGRISLRKNDTPWKFTSSTLKIDHPKRKGSSSSRLFFSGELLNFGGVHPGRLTWNLKMKVWKMIFLVNFPGCSWKFAMDDNETNYTPVN